MENSNIYLTEYGKYVSLKSKMLLEKKAWNYHVDESQFLRKYCTNVGLIQSQIEEKISKSDNVIIIAPGPLSKQSKKIICNANKSTTLLAGIQFTNFHRDFELDIVISTHVLPLMAAQLSYIKAPLFIHGVYSMAPPVLENSLPLRWSDPYISPPTSVNGKITGRYIIDVNSKLIKDPYPYITVPRNVMLFASFALLFLGAKKLTLAGFDPDNPSYFFSKNEKLKLEIVKFLSMSDPYISGWDGRKERIPPTDTLFRQNDMIKSIACSKPVSGVASGWRHEELIRGTKLLKLICAKKMVQLSRIGDSKFCDRLNIDKFM